MAIKEILKDSSFVAGLEDTEIDEIIGFLEQSQKLEILNLKLDGGFSDNLVLRIIDLINLLESDDKRDLIHAVQS